MFKFPITNNEFKFEITNDVSNMLPKIIQFNFQLLKVSQTYVITDDVIKYSTTNDVIKFGVTNVAIKYPNTKDFIRCTITNVVIEYQKIQF